MSRETIGLRVYHVSRLADVFARPVDVTTDDLIDWLGGHDWKPNTKRSYRASWRAFWRWAVSTGRLDHSPAADLPAIRIPRAKPRPTPDEVFDFGLRVADARAWRAIMLGGTCGLRRGEIARSHTDWMERDLVGWSLRVIGKGGHERLVPLPADLAHHILRLPAGYLFPSPNGGHLTPAHLGRIVKRYLESHTTHTLRHRAGTKAYAVGKDIRAVQEFLGHAKPETTAIYTEVPASAIRAAMEGARPGTAA
ncbi:tyrosine-type recombinase/integrase [Nocardioides sp. R1-1]|uniref:tyrosine-type recombinase/integrase n=1 Tax=Nocardioides sp. R1-1 TaxID=3383502 RepID=UPI0038CFDF7C